MKGTPAINLKGLEFGKNEFNSLGLIEIKN